MFRHVFRDNQPIEKEGARSSTWSWASMGHVDWVWVSLGAPSKCPVLCYSLYGNIYVCFSSGCCRYCWWNVRRQSLRLDGLTLGLGVRSKPFVHTCVFLWRLRYAEITPSRNINTFTSIISMSIFASLCSQKFY